LGHTHRVVVTPSDGDAEYSIDASTGSRATGATPRVLRPPCRTVSGSSTGGRSTTSDRLPDHLIVVGSGVTGAEFASAYLAMGVAVTLVSSRERVMPHEDPTPRGPSSGSSATAA
jgi:dihydrolipoamide dehydrogenase